MTLTLEIVGPAAAQLGNAARKVFAGVGGTIGRLAENDWMVPDPYISGRHARIEFRNGQYFLVDTSTNGVFLNSPDHRLPKGESYALKTGDRVFIDAYEIKVTVAAAQSAAKSPLSDLFGPASQSPAVPNAPLIPDDPFATDAMPAPPSPARASARPSGFPEDLGVDDHAIDPLEALGFGAKTPKAPAAPKAAELVARSPLNDHYVPPSTAPLRDPSPAVIDALIPDDYDPLKDFGVQPQSAASAPAPKPAARPTPGARVPAAKPDPFALIDAGANKAPPTPVRTQEPRAPQKADIPAPPAVATAPAATQGSSAGSFDFAAMLAAAGLQGVQMTPELAANFGRIINVVVAGLMDVLRARERIKDEFRIRVTTFKATANNPLKFSANVEDALHNLLVKRNPAYLGPVEAFEDAFEDVRNHQMAMLAGLRVAFDAMLSQFDPKQLQVGFDKQVKKGSLLAGPARLRYWELYRDTFAELTKDPDNAFGDLFGDEFARAYAEQMDRLKAERASKK